MAAASLFDSVTESSRPNWETVWAKAAGASVRSVISAATTSVVPPAFLMSAAVVQPALVAGDECDGGAVLGEVAAVTAPMPLLAPVTTGDGAGQLRTSVDKLA